MLGERGAGRDQLDLQPNENLYALSDLTADGNLRLWGEKEELQHFPPHPFEGARVGDRYRITKYLAKGSYCHCFKATDTLEDSVVCLKTFKPQHFYQQRVQEIARKDNVKGLLACRSQKRLQDEQCRSDNPHVEVRARITAVGRSFVSFRFLLRILFLALACVVVVVEFVVVVAAAGVTRDQSACGR